MFKRLKASPATQGASAAGSRASEKKEKKKTDNRKIIGYGASIVFILAAVFQTTKAFSNINTASIVYNTRLAQMKAEEQKAKNALEDKLNISIHDDGTIINKDDTSDSNPIDSNAIGSNSANVNKVDKSDSDYYYTDDNGQSIIHVDDNGDKTTYHICTTCSECGAVTNSGDKCSKCGSDLYKYVVYQVNKGDTLSKISGEVGASVDSIAHLNEIDNVNLIYAGESLRIPE